MIDFLGINMLLWRYLDLWNRKTQSFPEYLVEKKKNHVTYVTLMPRDLEPYI